MVAQPGDYAWSSHSAHANEQIDPLLIPNPEYLAQGAGPGARASAYRALFAEVLPGTRVEEIRSYLQQEKALGSDRFRFWAEAGN